ncbi:MAG: hypothetical protein C0599_07570 [Salinivirgaceae bacterium]|nr:MAG: hypothetical protein C0599_07570 [Salinivirgaceae bacterium]
METKNYSGYRDLIVYKKAFDLSMKVYKLSFTFPKEEKYALTDQVRRSSRAVGAAITESWPKRRYPKHFVLKLTESQSEACETNHWLDVAKECKYINSDIHSELFNLCLEVQKMLESMIRKPEKFCINVK